MNTYTVTVADPTAELVTYGAGAYIELDRASTIGGAYSAIGTKLLDAMVNNYGFTDEAGVSTDYYKYRLSSANGQVQSAFSAPALAGTTGLCSLADVRARINPDNPSDTSQDAYLPDYVTAATDLIHAITGRYFLQDPETGTSVFYFSGDGSRTLRIPRGIVSVTMLELASSTGGAYTTLTENTDFWLMPAVQSRSYPDASPDRIELNDYGSWIFYPGYRTVKLTGVLGHAAVPATIERIALETVTRAWRRRPSGDTYLGGSGDAELHVKWSMSLDDRKLLESLFAWGPRVA